MLTERELTKALLINVKNWDWSINSKFEIDEKTGKSLVYEIDDIKSSICDDCCKYPQLVKEMWLKDEIQGDRDEYMEEHYCDSCPLGRL